MNMKLETLETRALLAGLGDDGDLSDDASNNDNQVNTNEQSNWAEDYPNVAYYGNMALDFVSTAAFGIKEGATWVAGEVFVPAVTGALAAPIAIPAAGFFGGAAAGEAAGHEAGKFAAKAFCDTEMSEYVYDSAETCEASLVHLGEVGGAGVGATVGLAATTMGAASVVGGYLPLIKAEAFMGAVSGLGYEQFSVWYNGSESNYAQWTNNAVTA
ncbi:MAG TPA: hypothetical protein DIU37_04115 [Opitutae bacterium]|nr:hypothetical protein [Opitutae bacterium]|tara:strand:- start:888 stop:1529 length:642 start_codon:yes stop_codon:yes gene_type:complete